MVDIGQELLQKITDTFEKSLKGSRRANHVNKLIETGKPITYQTVDDYAKEVGNLLAKSVRLHVDADVLPEGKMFYNIADKILPDRLTRNYSLISKVSVVAQERMNKAFGVNLKAQVPKLNKDRIDGFLEMVSNAENFDLVADSLRVGIINFSQSVVTDFIEDNFNFQANVGLSPVIVRSTDGNCCEWCNGLAGVYNYPVDREVYQRHQSCTCTVSYIPSLGKIQGAYSKREYDSLKQSIEGEKAYAAYLDRKVLSMKPRK